jgi:hypothetical protein
MSGITAGSIALTASSARSIFCTVETLESAPSSCGFGGRAAPCTTLSVRGASPSRWRPVGTMW